MSTARTVVVTGAAGGIGSEIVNRFLAHGDTVVASDISPEALDTWRARWDSGASGGQHPSLHTVPADISSEQSVAALAQVVQQSLGTVDVLINNAGHFPQTAFEEMSADEWRQVIDVNLTGTFLMIRAFVPLMKASGHGRIVNIGSGSVFSGTPMQSHYVASKGGVMGLTHVLARELGGYGITVNLITPGLTVTPAAAESVKLFEAGSPEN
ncbi:SDR family NAD(P)-dependent oxidoreductase [Frankia gtarii]|uniref:SDR family NAD(P)-dependent oxidoreductase n=1 Tax=Frankia gtarii TaxID=2950102 RepID=UPI0021C0785A|nr:SDR family oxidoreductase [Frankia gtarii]